MSILLSLFKEIIVFVILYTTDLIVARVDVGCSWRPNHIKSCVVYFSTVDS